MVPVPGLTMISERNHSARADSETELRNQWSQPADVFSVLLLLGGEIVNRALAQLAGGTFTPVTFSFGWVSYAMNMLLAAVGDAKLMPSATEACLLINAKSGYSRSNSSWILCRLLRDYESWMHPAVRARLERILDDRWRYTRRNTKAGTAIPKPGQTGLCISVYEPNKYKTGGIATRDSIYWTGVPVAILQLIIAVSAIATVRDWSILVITLAGTILALVTGSLKQWRIEKWPCRRISYCPYVLTTGNGAQHAILILGNGHGLNLEDLASSSQMQFSPSSMTTRLSLAVISMLWVVLLISAAGLRKNTWYLLAIGGVGVLQNVLVAGWRRRPDTLGIHLDFCEVIGEMQTMDALLAIEKKYSGVGKTLLPIFFPGELRADEITLWEDLANTVAQHPPLEQVQAASNLPPESWVAHAKTFEK